MTIRQGQITIITINDIFDKTRTITSNIYGLYKVKTHSLWSSMGDLEAGFNIGLITRLQLWVSIPNKKISRGCRECFYIMYTILYVYIQS